MEEYYKIIFEALEKGGGIEKVIETIAGDTGMPIALMDPYGEILADSYISQLSLTKEEGDKEKDCWIRMIEEYYSKELGEEGADLSQPVVCSDESGVRILNAVMVRGGLEGFCITLHKEREEQPDFFNKLICRALSVGYGRKDHMYNLKDSGVKQVISKLLLGNGKDMEHRLKIKEEVYETYAVPPFLLALIEPGNERNINAWKFRNQLSENFSDALIYVDKEKITVLFGNIDSDKKQENVCNYLKQLLISEDGTCGISEPFERRGQIDAKRTMLERLIRIGKQIDTEERLYTEYKYYLELVCSYAHEAIGESGCFCRQLKLLEQEDREKGTEFYKSLKEYLLMGNNVNLAAKKLYIHRNTMVYRLAKIHEMLKLDVNDPEVAKRLMLSILLRNCM